MAKATKNNSKKSTPALEIVQPGPAVAIEEPNPTQESEPQTDAPPADEQARAAEISDTADRPADPPLPPRNRGGRPPKNSTPDNSVPFFDRVKAIPEEDWANNRVYLYLYLLEPVCDLKKSGGKAYVNRYEKPVLDEHEIMIDYGSGVWKLVLSNQRSTTMDGPPIAYHIFEILNPKYPNTMPRDIWVADTRNRKWAALAAAAAQPQATAAATVTPGSAMGFKEAYSVIEQIERRVEDRHRPAEAPAPPDPAAQLKAVVGAVKDIVAMNGQPGQANGSDDAAMRELRAELRETRQAQLSLLTTLLEDARKPRENSNGFTVVKDLLSSLKDFLPTIKELLPAAVEGVTGGSSQRSRMNDTQEFWQPIVSEALKQGGPIVDKVTGFLMMRAAQQGLQQRQGQQGQQPPHPQQQPNAGLPAPAPPQNGNTAATAADVPMEANDPTPQQQAAGGMLQVINDSLLSAIDKGRSGAEYADAFDTLFGSLQYRQICGLGKEGLLQMIATLPMWPRLGTLQAQMPQFVEEFIHAFDEEDPGDTGEGLASPKE